MQKVKVITVGALFYTCFLVLWCLPVRAETVLLWQNRDAGIYGSLPDNWRPMASEELEAFSRAGKELLLGTGDFVSGFLLQDTEHTVDGPYILVFANQEGRVAREEMQKTYSWFQKNNELVSGVLPKQVKGMSIENIEYLQDRFTILFQIRMAMEKEILTGMSGIVFLQNGYLTIIGFAGDQVFPDYAGSFYSFISKLSVPPSLRYNFSGAEDADSVSLVSAWIVDNWQPISGAVLLLGVYGIVFWRGEKLKAQR